MGTYCFGGLYDYEVAGGPYRAWSFDVSGMGIFFYSHRSHDGKWLFLIKHAEYGTIRSVKQFLKRVRDDIQWALRLVRERNNLVLVGKDDIGRTICIRKSEGGLECRLYKVGS